jgi:thiol-disulfide isomerase/thioredoxin
MSGDINKEEEEEEENNNENKEGEDENEKSADEEVSLAAAELLRLALLANKDALKTTTRIVFPGKVHELTRGGEEFKEILYQKKKNKNNHCYSLIVLVYSMENCQPCRVFAPKIEQMAREYGESVSVAFVKCLINESDANRRLASEAGVTGFPCSQIFDGATGRKVISEDIKGANDVKLREVLEQRSYNVEKFDRLKDAAFAALSEAKAKLVANEDERDREERRFATLVKTVTAYASNAIEKEDAKYKRINVNGKAFTERVKSCGEEGEKCLRAFGFEKKKIKEDEESGDESEEAYYEISPLVFDEFHENNPFTKREMRRVIDMLRALTG